MTQVRMPTYCGTLFGTQADRALLECAATVHGMQRARRAPLLVQCPQPGAEWLVELMGVRLIPAVWHGG